MSDPHSSHLSGVTHTTHNIAVIGGGVAGLSASLALQRAGLAPLLYEGRSDDAFAGMGFLLMPNGAQALRELTVSPREAEGARDPMSACGAALSEMCLFSRGGELIGAKSAAGAYGVSRPELMSLISDLGVALGVRHLSGHTLRAISNTPQGFSLSFHHAPPQAARCVVGADGVRSTVRRDLLGVSALSPSEVLEFVGVSPASALRALPLGGPLGLGGARDPSALVKIQDAPRRLAFGYMPLPGERLIWYAQMAQEDGEMPSEEGEVRRAALLALFDGWPPVVRALLMACPFERTYRWDTRDLPPLATARYEGALLVGDAAHASLTLSSQGVSGALEDAVELERLGRALALGELTGRPDLLAPRWRDLCARFEAARAPVWRRRYEEARALQRDFLTGDTRRGVPVVAP